jgi:acyl carrier protein
VTGVPVRERLARLVEAASDGEVTRADALTGEPLRALGLTSLGYLRLIDAIEAEYGVDVDLAADSSTMDTIDGVVAQLAARGVTT